MLDLTNANYFENIDIDESREYIHIGLRNYIITYENTTEGIQEKEVIKEYDIIKCDESNYKTEFEQKYYKTYIRK